MAVTATQYFAIFALLLFLGIALFWLGTALRFGGAMGQTVYTRGLAIVGEGRAGRLSCPAGRKIRIFRGRYMCGASDLAGREVCDPFTPSGGFSEATRSAVEELEGACNGKSECTFTLGRGLLPEGCDGVCDPEEVMLNASYDCVPA